ncbi:MAG: phage late control D family protein [Myxococcales bacterium]|nr:phage late control D family protein [Myxococcales bacterium]MCB9670648.1 phage late control D family protein [Alphaproteobacteria bacterium]MCB9693790.1 phage late control D family protein [Alphaproteobacteria bacterium]
MSETALELKIDGDATVMDPLVRCEVVEAYDQLDTLVATFAVHHHSDPALGEKLVVGLPYEVALKSDGTAVTTLKGDIIEVRHVRRAGRHRVTVVGLDSLHRLSDKHAPAQIWDVTHDQIVSEIASRNGLTGSAEGVDGTAGELLQNEGSDALFLKKLAAENNYFVRVEDTELVFGRKQGSGSVTIDYADEPAMDIEQVTCLDGIVTKVTVHGSDYVQDEAFTGESTSSDLQVISGGDTGVAKVNDLVGARELILNQSGYGDASRATARAKAEMLARAERFLRGSVWVRGNPDAHSGKTVTITGAGWPLDGTFLIRQTAHVHDAHGYRTRIDFVSDSLPSKS